MIKDKKFYVNTDKLEIPYKSEIISINGKSTSQIIEKLLSHSKNESEEFEEISASPHFSNNFWHRYGSFEDFEIEYINHISSIANLYKINGKTPQEIKSLRNKELLKNYSF